MEQYRTVSISWSCLPLQVSCCSGMRVRWRRCARTRFALRPEQHDQTRRRWLSVRL